MPSSRVTPETGRNDHGMVSLAGKAAYQSDLTARQDKSQMCSLYNTPLFVMPANYFGVTHGRALAPGGHEARPTSTVWRNDGSLKIEPSEVLQHQRAPFLIH